MSLAHRRRSAIAGAALILAAVGTAAPSSGRSPAILLNLSPSERPGLYRRSAGFPAVGRLVAVIPPLAARGEAAPRTSFLKTVGAAAGDPVCRRGAAVLIAGRPRARAAGRDDRGRPLPQWRECRPMRANELFLLSTRSPRSFDSRYWGPVTSSAVIGVYEPLAVL